MANKREEKYDVYMICSVRKATEEEKAELIAYRDMLEGQGLKTCYPAESTNQNDIGGYNICHDHTWEIENSQEVHVKWNPDSQGSYVDLGTAFHTHFVKGTPIRLINRDLVESIVAESEKKGVTKSYEHVLLKLDDLANE
jgi:hypothetical protein